MDFYNKCKNNAPEMITKNVVFVDKQKLQMNEKRNMIVLHQTRFLLKIAYISIAGVNRNKDTSLPVYEVGRW